MTSSCTPRFYVDVMMISPNGNIPHDCPFCEGNPPVIGGFSSQRPVTQSFEFSLICAWTNAWTNYRDAGDFRPPRAHYDVTVIVTAYSSPRLNAGLANRRCDSRFAPSQWETALFCNDVSHWSGASLESTMLYVSKRGPRWCNLKCLCSTHLYSFGVNEGDSF